MREFKIRWDKPVLEKQKEEALEKNIILLSKTDNSMYGYYELECGHLTFLHYGSVRKACLGKFQCKECLDIKLQQEADRFNLIYNKDIKSKGNDWRNYTFPCGHSRDMKTANVRFSLVACDVCKEQKFKQEAMSADCVMLPCVVKKGTRTYLLTCGHTKTTSTTLIRNKVLNCKTCQEDRYAKEAELAGIVYNRNVKSSHYDYRVYTLSCGCTKEIAISCVQKGTFECKTHSERWIDFSQPINVYLFKFTLPIGEVLKLGFTMDIKGRCARYGLLGEITPLFIREFKNGEDAVTLEKILHDKFDTDKPDKSVMKQYMENGFTECYPLHLFGKLKHEIENYKKEFEFV